VLVDSRLNAASSQLAAIEQSVLDVVRYFARQAVAQVDVQIVADSQLNAAS